MKKYFLASVALALSLGVANAGEAKFDGAYGGIQGNYSNGEIGESGLSVDADGFGGGVFGGYGKTFGNWYVGGELSADYAKTEGSVAGIDLDIEKKYSVGAAARVGYLITPKVMAYGVAGVERAKFKTSISDGVDSLKGSATVNGARFGVGAETFVTDIMSLRTEVDYINWNGGDLDEWRAKVGVAYHF
jgi:Opacity protein and related surface antigens